VANSTITDNNTGIGGLTGNVTLTNSIVAGNMGYIAPDNGGSASLGFNFLGGDPKLGPLQNNGGPTQTMALLAGSPAIGAGDPALATTFDQRGVRRVGAVDIGATAYYVWHNLVHNIDVDGNGHLAPNDALHVINVINAGLALSGLTKNPSTGPMYLDVNNDGFLFPNDALMVINNINAGTVLGPASLPSGGEGEGADLLLLLVLDIASQPRRRTSQ